jgi:hypothetical protein
MFGRSFAAYFGTHRSVDDTLRRKLVWTTLGLEIRTRGAVKIEG